MAKPEWGAKRQCLACATRFYDMGRDPIVCPKCETVFEPEAALKARRVRPDPKAKLKAAAALKAGAVVDELDDEEVDEDAEPRAVVDDEDEEEDPGIEELGGDEEDIIADADATDEEGEPLVDVDDAVEEEEVEEDDVLLEEDEDLDDEDLEDVVDADLDLDDEKDR
ncbi:TIGR02300 family protein [Oleomonas cavernae]|uniref:TIGR02300 family protein n=1 Tax=Oleomonas cavernae TaxID=2320859 RepID=A0A418WT71_9PROT|nr:TIGR02300 family protein [Oleomonas cavernae]RJF94376.1 TIGR02300 family protein [Oleomonas cavernae]